jgi:predicted class III extradiol MEMO1 family dioxygenase
MMHTMHVQGDPQAFTDYLKSYGNTICGRHPISVFLNVRCLTPTH